jgi:hypothetical protein
MECFHPKNTLFSKTYRIKIMKNSQKIESFRAKFGKNSPKQGTLSRTLSTFIHTLSIVYPTFIHTLSTVNSIKIKYLSKNTQKTHTQKSPIRTYTHAYTHEAQLVPTLCTKTPFISLNHYFSTM